MRDEDFWKLIARGVPDECWPWLGGIKRDSGYGYLYIAGRQHRAHRIAFERAGGAIPEGLVLDHLCRNRSCCNPAHLEPVTVGENVKRGENARRSATHCKHGHEWTPENTRFNARLNRRECRQCDRDRRPAVNPIIGKTHCIHGHPWVPENIYTRPSTGHHECRTCMKQREAARERVA
jgi:hypothetical protein